VGQMPHHSMVLKDALIDRQTSCNKVHCQADIRMCSHCLFPVVVTSLEQVDIILLQG
jgi:hypothetical protein